MVLGPGVVLSGRYAMVSQLGHGGAGEVWEARDRATNTTVAVKLLRQLHRANAEALARFTREGEILSRIRSPHVSRLFAACVDEKTGVPFLVVERLNGEPLDVVLAGGRALPIARARQLVEEILAGVAAIHQLGVIHRDLKPANIFMTDTGHPGSEHPERRAVLIDFGIAKLLGDAHGGLTSDAATLGSPRYMAPEQMGGASRVDERSDIYAAATVAFRALSGQLPFAHENPARMLVLKSNYEAATLAERTGRPWPESLERFFRRALARDPTERPPTANDARVLWASACHEAARDPRGVPVAATTEIDDAAETPVLSPRIR